LSTSGSWNFPPAGWNRRTKTPKTARRPNWPKKWATGPVAGEQVAAFYTSPGYSDERLIVFLAQDLEYVGANPEESEDIERVHLTLNEMRKMLAGGQLQDAKTIIGLQALANYLDSHNL
jgi:ADP-ribose pyrophosphatase